MNAARNENYSVSPYLVLFLVYTSMVGIGILRFQRDLITFAGYDSWIAVLLTGVGIHIVVWMMFKVLNSDLRGGGSLIEINRAYFGKVAGMLVNLLVILYFFLGSFVVYRVFISVIQIWLFPTMNMLPLSIVIAVLLYYTVTGGFRTVIGICFWGVLASSLFVVPLNFLILPYLHPHNLLPMFNHSIHEILSSSREMVFQYLGIESLLMVYPFIGTPAKSQKWAQLAVFFVTLLYLMLLIITLMYYNEGLLHEIVWPTLNTIMILELPLMQRLEYIVISLLFIKIVASISLGLWIACHGMKYTVRANKSYCLVAFLVCILIMQYFTFERESIKWISGIFSTAGFYFVFGYIPLLFVVSLFKGQKSLPS
jgi:spore germination protein (amino acid permease)